MFLSVLKGICQIKYFIIIIITVNTSLLLSHPLPTACYELYLMAHACLGQRLTLVTVLILGAGTVYI